MDDTILAIYCLCDDLLKALGHREDPQSTMSDGRRRSAHKAREQRV